MATSGEVNSLVPVARTTMDVSSGCLSLAGMVATLHSRWPLAGGCSIRPGTVSTCGPEWARPPRNV